MPDPRRITLLSFRTFGDYVLKAPFLFELYRRYPDGTVTVLTNSKGGQVYPLLDSRLKVVVVDRATPRSVMLRTLATLPRADLLYAVDDSRTTLVLALVLRARRRTGWVQGISRLYREGGFFEWNSVRAWLARAARMRLRPARVRLPEDKYEGDVELGLLDLEGTGATLAHYRSSYARKPAPRSSRPHIYCAAEAGWRARQLTAQQWTSIIAGLLSAFPEHNIVVHGAAEATAGFAGEPRVMAYAQQRVPELFDAISSADLVIAPDSFALHIASLYDVPAIGYFGPAHPHRFRPTGPNSSTLFRQPACSPCLQSRGESLCQRGLVQCTSLAELTADDFLSAAELVRTVAKL